MDGCCTKGTYCDLNSEKIRAPPQPGVTRHPTWAHRQALTVRQPDSRHQNLRESWKSALAALRAPTTADIGVRNTDIDEGICCCSTQSYYTFKPYDTSFVALVGASQRLCEEMSSLDLIYNRNLVRACLVLERLHCVVLNGAMAGFKQLILRHQQGLRQHYQGLERHHQRLEHHHQGLEVHRRESHLLFNPAVSHGLAPSAAAGIAPDAPHHVTATVVRYTIQASRALSIARPPREHQGQNPRPRVRVEIA